MRHPVWSSRSRCWSSDAAMAVMGHARGASSRCSYVSYASKSARIAGMTNSNSCGSLKSASGVPASRLNSSTNSLSGRSEVNRRGRGTCGARLALAISNPGPSCPSCRKRRQISMPIAHPCYAQKCEWAIEVRQQCLSSRIDQLRHSPWRSLGYSALPARQLYRTDTDFGAKDPGSNS
jgi:hypothetical protein